MTAPPKANDVAVRSNDDREGGLPPLLFVLTVVTGLVDAVSYLALGHVFVANMTGNVVFVGFALAGAQDFSIPASLVAVAAFLVGALAGGRLGAGAPDRRHWLFAVAIFVKLALVGAATVVAAAAAAVDADLVRYGLIVLLALAMGLQNAVVRHLAVPDLTTTVLTLTLTGIAADSSLAGGTNPRWARRVWAATAMAAGAAVGAFVVLRYGAFAALAVTFVLLASNAIAAHRLWRRAEPRA